jgi:hypothetical protein
MLYALFSTHGPIIEVVALKTNKMRGQAFVIYKGECFLLRGGGCADRPL